MTPEELLIALACDQGEANACNALYKTTDGE